MSVEDDVRALLKDSSSPIDDELLNKRSDDDKKPIAEIEIALGTNDRESDELSIVPILSKYDQVVGSDSPIISQIATTAVTETSKTTGNRSSYTVEQPKPIEPFDWCKYLRETQSQSAPEDCFFQNPKIPINMFREEKKLELPDPRGPGCLCLGTIQALHSVWVCVRLDGCDDTNDQWIICDDKDLHPVGYCSKSGANLQPPVGFRPNLAHFHKFLETQLKRSSLRIDADGSDTMMNPDDNPACPEEWFQPISDELHPKTNRFIVGHKVEAIDHKNFNGRVCPATIVNVDGDHIEINFDGWNHAYNVKERYDSRHIFPVGWAKKVGLEVQPPRQTKRKSRSSVNSHASSVPVSIAAAATPAPATVRSRAKRGRKAYTPTVDEDMDEDLPISSAIDTLRLKVAKRGRGNRRQRKLRIVGNTDTSEPIELPPVAISTSPETTTTTATASVVPIRIRLVPTERRNTTEKSSPPQCYRLNEVIDNPYIIFKLIQALRRLQMSKGAEQRDTSETASDDLSTSSPPPSLQQHYRSDVRVTDVGNESDTKKEKQSEFMDNVELKKDGNTASSKSTMDIINKTGTSTTSQDHRNSEKHLKTTVDNNVSSVNARARKTFTMRTTPVVATTISPTTTVTSVVPIAPKTVTAASNNIDSTRNRVELLNTQQQSFASTMLLPGIVVQRMPTTTRLNSSSTNTTTTSSSSSHNMILSSSETQSTTSHIPANTSPDIVLSSSDNIAWEQLQMTVYLNRNCSCGSLLNASKLVALPQQIGPANMHHIIRETIQQLVNAADNTRLVFRKIEAGLPRVLCVTAEINGFTHVRTLPTFKDLPRAWQYLRTFVDRLGVCPNFLTQKPIACQMCAPVLRRADDNDDEEEDDEEEEKHHIAVTSPTESANCSSTGGRKRKRTTKTTTRASTDESDESSTATERGGEVSGNTSQAHNKLALEHWSVDDVADSLLSIADSSISYKFRNNQIDGKALLLLTTDLMMKHMDLAFGPALKIMAHVENLKHL